MAAAAPPHNRNDNVVPVPAAAQELNNKTIVYERDVLRQLRVLDAKMGKLELQLNDELEKISSCSGLLEEIIVKPQAGSPCSSVRAELHRVRAKRDKAYQKLQRKQQQLEMTTMEIRVDEDDNAAASANPPPIPCVLTPPQPVATDN